MISLIRVNAFPEMRSNIQNSDSRVKWETLLFWNLDVFNKLKRMCPFVFWGEGGGGQPTHILSVPVPIQQLYASLQEQGRRGEGEEERRRERKAEPNRFQTRKQGHKIQKIQKGKNKEKKSFYHGWIQNGTQPFLQRDKLHRVQVQLSTNTLHTSDWMVIRLDEITLIQTLGSHLSVRIEQVLN